MKDKIVEWADNHPYMSIFFAVVFSGVIGWLMSFGAKNYLKQYQMEQAKTADFVMYTSDGEMLGMEHEVIVDMDTGYQYLVFNIHGDYVIAPRVSEDGTFYKTIE